MEEDDIRLLIKMNHWVSVVPHDKKWKGVIWKMVGKEWRQDKSRVHSNPIKCYEWAADIVEKIYIEYVEN